MLVPFRKNKSSKILILRTSGWIVNIYIISCITLSSVLILTVTSLFKLLAPPQNTQSNAHPLEVIIALSISP